MPSVTRRVSIYALSATDQIDFMLGLSHGLPGFILNSAYPIYARNVKGFGEIMMGLLRLVWAGRCDRYAYPCLSMSKFWGVIVILGATLLHLC